MQVKDTVEHRGVPQLERFFQGDREKRGREKRGQTHLFKQGEKGTDAFIQAALDTEGLAARFRSLRDRDVETEVPE